jgi:hypothetical protein
MLTRIEHDPRGWENRFYKCTACRAEEAHVFKQIE